MTERDRNFDDLADRFRHRIGDQLKGVLRREVVFRDLAQHAPAFATGGWRVLDAGGGYGQMAIDAARRGHDVTYCDLSAVMTGHALAAAAEAGQQDRIRFLTGPAQSALPDEQWDLVYAHAMLEWTAHPRDVLTSLAARVAPGGLLSLLVFNRWSYEFNLLRLGDLDPILSGNLMANAFKLTPTHPIDPDELSSWLDEAQCHVLQRSGVRVFCDYMQRERRQRFTDDQLLPLELAYSQREPFWRMGRYLHVLARRATAD